MGGIVGVNEVWRSPQPQVEKLRWGRIKGTSQPRLLLKPDSERAQRANLLQRSQQKAVNQTESNEHLLYDCTTKWQTEVGDAPLSGSLQPPTPNSQ